MNRSCRSSESTFNPIFLFKINSKVWRSLNSKRTGRPAKNALTIWDSDLFAVPYTFIKCESWFVTLQDCWSVGVYQNLVESAHCLSSVLYYKRKLTDCRINDQTDIFFRVTWYLLTTHTHTQYGTRVDHVLNLLIARRPSKKRAIRVLADVTRSKSAVEIGERKFPSTFEKIRIQSQQKWRCFGCHDFYF